jgi:hypothetical protein
MPPNNSTISTHMASGYLLFGSAVQPSAIQNVGWTLDFQKLVSTSGQGRSESWKSNSPFGAGSYCTSLMLFEFE